MSYCIGIDVTADAIRLAQVSRKRGRLSWHGTCTRVLGPNGLPRDADAIRALLSDALRDAGFRTNAKLVLGLPAEHVFFHTLRTDLTVRQDIRRLVRFELEDDFPIPFEDLLTDVCGRFHAGKGNGRYVAAAVSRHDLGPWIQALDGSGWTCSIVSTDVCALKAAARLMPDRDGGTISILVHADDRRMILAMMQDGHLICGRHTACDGRLETVAATLAREIERSMRGTLGRRQESPVRVLLSGPEDLVHELSARLTGAVGYEVQRLDPISVTQPPEALQCEGGFTIAMGLALLGLDSADDQLNFLQADPARAECVTKSHMKRAALVSAVLAAALLGLLGFRTVRELRGLQAEQTRLNGRIRTIFVEAFPGETKIVNELAQMTAHLDALRKQRDALVAAVGSSVRPLWALQIFSETIASGGGIRVSSFVVTEKAIHIVGTGDSFETIEQLLERLRQVPQFSVVELEDMASSRGSDRPEFRLAISVGTG